MSRVSLHTQRMDKSVISDAEGKRARRLRKAAACMFGPVKTSVWDLLTGGFPFLLGVFQRLAPLFPDRPLVRIVFSTSGQTRSQIDSYTGKAIWQWLPY